MFEPKRSGTTTATLIALMFGPLVLVLFYAYEVDRAARPSDAELTANFLAHESTLDRLAQMLSADGRSPAGKDTYRRLLRQISVADLHYFPDSGTLILVPDGEENRERPSESYVYLPNAQPESFIQHHGYYLHGPGVDIITRDSRLKGSWFIRHELTMQVAVTPY
ncbi:MAG TPA: hypothetical protein VMA54_05340 [Steroidobacteraceae bacterium]|nr:hypothetical protein [Steroidobacteraceae bacterium]